MSPEQVRGQAADPRSDQWSVGVVIFQMLTGEMAFRGPTQSDVISAILLHEPPSLASAAQLPEGLDSLLRRAMSKDPAARPQTAADFLRELKQLQAALQGRPGFAAFTPVPARPSSVVAAPAAATSVWGTVLFRWLSEYWWLLDRKSTRLNSSHIQKSRMPSSA